MILMQMPPELRCPEHAQSMVQHGTDPFVDEPSLHCPRGCTVPIIAGIPRFVPAKNYASAFGLQWKAFQRTQLDSYTGTTISRDRLTRCLGGSLDILRGKSVLEAGCGAGRFTEVLLSAGARVFACDLSLAVEANYANIGNRLGYFVCQADIRRLPVSPRSFDIVLCLGVIQHTPNPEQTIASLAEYVRPGGMLVIDHYTFGIPVNLSQKLLRQLFIRLPAVFSRSAVLCLGRMLLPLHRVLWGASYRKERLRDYLRKISPLVDYYDSYPQLGRKVLTEWALLDTHDTLTDYYKHLRTLEQIRQCLERCHLTAVEVSYGGNGIEARAKRAGHDGAVEGVQYRSI